MDAFERDNKMELNKFYTEFLIQEQEFTQICHIAQP